jgi:hypothetical protein
MFDVHLHSHDIVTGPSHSVLRFDMTAGSWVVERHDGHQLVTVSQALLLADLEQRDEVLSVTRSRVTELAFAVAAGKGTDGQALAVARLRDELSRIART